MEEEINDLVRHIGDKIVFSFIYEGLDGEGFGPCYHNFEDENMVLDGLLIKSFDSHVYLFNIIGHKTESIFYKYEDRYGKNPWCRYLIDDGVLKAIKSPSLDIILPAITKELKRPYFYTAQNILWCDIADWFGLGWIYEIRDIDGKILFNPKFRYFSPDVSEIDDKDTISRPEFLVKAKISQRNQFLERKYYDLELIDRRD